MIVEKILALDSLFITSAIEESGLSLARLIGERKRTVGQLNFFAQLIRERYALIDTTDPGTDPLPRPDIHSMQKVVGRLVFFGSSYYSTFMKLS